MSEPVDLYCNGYVATPIISAFRRRLPAFLDTREFRQREDLIRQTGANPRVLSVALRALQLLGWLEKSMDDGYRLSGRADVDRFGPDLIALYGIDPRQVIQQEPYVRSLIESIDAALLSAAPAGSLAEGAVMVPLILALRESGADGFAAGLDKLDTTLAQKIRKLFVTRRWLSPNGSKLTRAGRLLLEADEFRVVASYRPLLHRIDDLLFGNSSTGPRAGKEISGAAQDCRTYAVGHEEPAEIVRQLQSQGLDAGEKVLYVRSSLKTAIPGGSSQPAEGDRKSVV